MSDPRCIGADDPDLGTILDLIRSAFRGMEGRVDPPSSIHRLTLAALTEHAARGEVWAIGTPPLATVIATPQGDHLYLGKLAVAEAARGRGLARRLIDACAAKARALNVPTLRLQTRIELTENHATFAALGFHEIDRTAHPGYDRPTSITFERPIGL